jgi:predicted RNase H-like HicB family nuclease
MGEGDELRYSLRVAWSPEDSAFVAECPEFEGISALGSSYGEAISELEAALGLAVEASKEEGWAIPEPIMMPRYSGQFRLRVPRSLHGWLVDRAQREGISLNTLVVELLSEARGALGAGDRAMERLDAIIRRVESMVTAPAIGDDHPPHG